MSAVILLAFLLPCCANARTESAESTAGITESSAVSSAEPMERQEREPPLATIVTASDFQSDGAFFTFRILLDQASLSGIPTPDCAILGGDYSIPLESDPDDGIRRLSEKLSGVYPEFDSSNAVFVQGNHDNPTDALTPTGAHDMGEFVVYCLNEDDFPTIFDEQPMQDMEDFLSGMVKRRDYRPVIIASHFPLHDSPRADNPCGGELTELLNRYGHTLDILYLFGHNHSGNFDDPIGGSVNYIAKGESLYVPVLASDGSGRIDGNTKMTLDFSYLNYGYVGYSNNTVSDFSTNVLTLGVLQIYSETVEIIRYSAEGEYCRYSIPLQNIQTVQKAA